MTGTQEDPWLGPRFEEALGYVLRVHGGQTRKASTIPYVSHLLGVAGLVLSDGGDEDEAIAALLHDAVEDQGGAPRLEDIRRRFGQRVGELVAACTEIQDDPKPPWQVRKEAYLEHLRHLEDQGALRVSLADKLDNVRSMVADRRRVGDRFFDRFNAPKESQRWYYGQLVDAFSSSPLESPMAAELAEQVAILFEDDGQRL
jgi:(p)ppGpp synthase/HD superfamily hydrolase